MQMKWYSSPSASSTGERWGSTYDVFLSFRGPDTRKTFVDVLYTSLIDAGVQVFRDNEELPVGHGIHSALFHAIRCSKISIPIFSSGYASSKSCLMEVAQMVECRRTGDHTILPIFYDVEPSVVKNQKDAFGEALREHERDGIDTETIDTWKEALREIGEMKGWELACYDDGHYVKLIRVVVSHVQKLLKNDELVIPEKLVGHEHHVEEMKRKLDVASNDVRIVGIHGIGGIGKTTLAKVVYNELCHRFDNCCFIENISELPKGTEGFKQLLRQIASDLLKKQCKQFSTSDEGAQFLKNRFCSSRVLLLLDDVDEQLKALLWVRDRFWFGQGSKVIVTTKRCDVLDLPIVHAKHEVPPMGDCGALELFQWHAFGGLFPRNSYHNLSKEIVSNTGGLPLALEVIGAQLYNKPKELWEGTRDKLKERPLQNERLKKTLMISYEYLDYEQKKIFLDIACFFIGKDKRVAFYMWEDCKFYPKQGIGSLIDLSLVKIGNNGELSMHAQLRSLGREIVRMENPQNPSKRSRLWNHEDAFSTLSKKKGTEKVEALSLTFKDECCSSFSLLEFDPLSNLRFLKLDQANIRGDLSSCLSTLRWLDWEGCSSAAALLNFHLGRLVILDLSSSQISQDRDSWDQIMKMAKELKVLNLKQCANLRGSPSFPAQMALEMLIFESCSRLRQIDPSISNLKDLKTLNLKFCHEVAYLPEGLSLMRELKELLIDGTSVRKIHFLEGSMEKLETLSACGCRSLDQISDSIGCLKSLTKLLLDESLIRGLPASIGNLVKLQNISLRNCQNLLKLPDSVGKLKLLLEVDLSNTKIKELPSSFKNLENLKVLKMEGCFLREFPRAITNLKMLEEIDFSLCRNFSGEISFDALALSSLRILRLSCTQISGVTAEICRLSHLQILDLLECSNLQSLPMLPSSVISLQVGSGSLHVAPDISELTNLKKLQLAIVTEDNPDSLSHLKWTSLSKLEALHLTALRLHQSFLDLSDSTALILRLHQSFHDLSKLRELSLSHVDLQYFRQFPSSLSTLCLKNCRLTAESLDVSNLSSLSKLEVSDSDVAEIHGLEHLEALHDLKICNCSMKRLDGLDHLSNLRDLSLTYCDSLDGLPDLSRLKLLEKREIEYCKFQ